MAQRIPVLFALAVCALPMCVACGSDEDPPSETSGGTGGTGVMAGTGGSVSGRGGSSGTGQGGTVSAGGSGGTAGTGAASGGKPGAGAGGASAGSAGANAGHGGAAAGAGGASGGASGASSGGMSGAAGAAMGGLGGGGGMGGANAGGSGGSAGAGAFNLTNPDFANMAGCSKDMATSCAVFPRELASYMSGPNISPELAWTGAPAGTLSFALVLQDDTNGIAHWAIWNISGSLTMLAADIDKDTSMPAVPAGSQQTNATFANATTMDGYFGPGSSCNVYEFVLYALSTATFTPTSTTDANAVRTALDGAGATVLGKASLRGRQNYNDMCN